MSKKQRKFADDAWAVWVDGDDLSTVYINDWLNPKGKSYVDLAVRIRGVLESRALHVYVPFPISQNEIEDVSLHYSNRKILQATFSAACIVDYKKNEHTSEIAYNRKTVDIVHISTLEYELKQLSEGTIINVDLEKLRPFLDNDEAYFVWRMPHKSLDEIFKPHISVGSQMDRLRDLITTPVVSEKYSYSVRVNESRLLPEEITRQGAFHRQKLKKTVITISVDESYDINDSGCYRISRLEEALYENYLPEGYRSEDVISYQWKQNRNDNVLGHFNFYYSISKESVSKASMMLYMAGIFLLGMLGDMFTETVFRLTGLFN